MNTNKLVGVFGTVFAIALATVALVTFLWNTIGHRENAINWETSLRYALIFGIVLKWAKSRETKVQ